MAKDATIWPVRVAEERTGLTRDQLVGNWGVQTLTRRFADGSSEEAILVPNYLTHPPELPADER